MVRFNELGSYSKGFGKNSSVSAALETIGTTGLSSCEELQHCYCHGPCQISPLFLHTSSNTCVGISSAALEVRHPGMILEFSVFKAMPLIDIIIMFFHYYLVSAH